MSIDTHRCWGCGEIVSGAVCPREHPWLVGHALPHERIQDAVPGKRQPDYKPEPPPPLRVESVPPLGAMECPGCGYGLTRDGAGDWCDRCGMVRGEERFETAAERRRVGAA